MWLQNDRQDGTVRSPLYRPIPPDVPTYIIYTRPSWRASWQLETESNSNPRPDSVRHSVSSQRSVGQKWQRGSRSQIYSRTYERIYIYIYVGSYDSPTDAPTSCCCFFWGGAARWGACWLKQKLYFQGVLLHIAGCLNFLVFL